MPGQTATLPPQAQCQTAPVRATPVPEPPKQEQKPVASAAPPEASDAATPRSGEDDKDGAALRLFAASDLEMARITEDLIDLLIGRNFTNFADFPNMAQAKLINRRALQSNMSALTNLVSDEENTFFSAIRRDPDRPQAAGKNRPNAGDRRLGRYGWPATSTYPLGGLPPDNQPPRENTDGPSPQ